MDNQGGKKNASHQVAVITCPKNVANASCLVRCNETWRRPPCKADVCTQVRPTTTACSMEAVVSSLERQYSLLTRIMHTLRGMQYENKANSEQLQEIIGTNGSTNGSANLDPDTKQMKSQSQSRMREDTAQYSTGGMQLKEMDSIVSPKFRDDGSARLTWERNSKSNEGVMRCPDSCPTCGVTIRLLLAEIDELRETRRYLLHVRYEANEILDEVMAKALEKRRGREQSFGYAISFA